MKTVNQIDLAEAIGGLTRLESALKAGKIEEENVAAYTELAGKLAKLVTKLEAIEEIQAAEREEAELEVQTAPEPVAAPVAPAKPEVKEEEVKEEESNEDASEEDEDEEDND